MEEPISMTNLNDFLFCPRSLYYGNIFRRSVGQDAYQQTPQKIGLAEHETVDEGEYSSRKTVITGKMVFCEKYGLLGRIDIYDAEKRILTERKWSITAVWEGFRLQLYAQFLAMTEMGFAVEKLRLHSKKDNKVYEIPLPSKKDIARLEEVIRKMREFKLCDPFDPNPRKCAACIYRELCDIYEAEVAEL